MARPLKDGVDYWPLDVGFFDDKKIKLIKGEFGIVGVHIAMLLLNEVYRTGGYYKKWDEDDCILMAGDIGGEVTPRLVSQVVARCCDRGLFDRGLFAELGVLTSRGIQRRFLRMFGQKRGAVPIITEYWLLGTDTEDIPASILEKILFKSVFGEKTPVFGSETMVLGTENALNKTKQNQTKQDKTKQQQSKQKETAQPPEERPAETHAERCAAAVSAFEMIKSPTSSDRRRIAELADLYGEGEVIAAIEDAARKGGQSVAYVERILEGESKIRAERSPVGACTAGIAARGGAQAGESRTADERSDLEYIMYSEWFEGVDWEEEGEGE